MKKLGFIAFLILLVIVVQAQDNQYIIKLKDKTGTPYNINRPQEFLSQRAIERRAKQDIPIVENDLPVNPVYLNSIGAISNVQIKNVSKWLNQVLIETDDPTTLDKITALPFVVSSQLSRRLVRPDFIARKKWTHDFMEVNSIYDAKGVSELDYGFSAGQVKIHHGEFLHDKGFKGKGMLVAVIDDGFFHYQSLPAFDSIRADNRILDTYDFVDNKMDMNSEDAHGMNCLSLIAANVPGQMIGTAPGASFLLYRSENVHSESLSEEQNWVAAAERSDSAGADVITTSLGYNQFDNPLFNHTYQDMNGMTTIIARGADAAASKGIIVMIAAGNEGKKTWHYITTPGDAINVLTVGAVNVSGLPADFSSYGPSSDGRVKPDVASVGVATVVQGPNGSFVSGNGTSFATPNLAGLVTCLWQAFQDFSAEEIMDAVRRSSSKYSTPDDRVGYGIPNFENAYDILEKIRAERLNQLLAGRKLLVYPNPGIDVIRIVVKPESTGNSVVQLYDISGRLCYKKLVSFITGQATYFELRRNSLPAGTYVLRFADGKNKYSEKIVWR